MNTVIMVVGLTAMVSVCGLAIWKGGKAARYGAMAYVAAWVGVMVFELGMGEAFPVVPMLLLDTLVALIFLGLALRYSNLWLGTAMILQGIVLGAHAMNLTSVAPPRLFGMNVFAMLVNMTSLGILVTFACATGATMMTRRKLRRARKAAAPDAIPGAAPASA